MSKQKQHKTLEMNNPLTDFDLNILKKQNIQKNCNLVFSPRVK